jgi:hypothetical protein
MLIKITGKFNQLVYNYPIRIPERFSLVIRSLLTQEGICLTLKPDFKFLEVWCVLPLSSWKHQFAFLCLLTFFSLCVYLHSFLYVSSYLGCISICSKASVDRSKPCSERTPDSGNLCRPYY